ncbi:F0F1 ATP synthase subunit B [Thalassobaculum sp.]|uniref:F0F1 ATP synthase subunit B n=1 Tax=Thalassobaculum sp. TaxID=2022740 RepID=UPI0032EF8D3A
MFADPTFWVAVSFVLFVALTFKMVWQKVTTALDARADEIRNRLEEAQNLREEAQAAKANYQRLQRDALKEAEAILAHAREEAKRMREDGEKKLEASLARREQLAVEKIAAAEAKALQDVREQMVDLAMAATRQLIESNIDGSVRSRLVADAVAEIPTRLQ